MQEAKEFPKMREIYGSLVFDQKAMKQRLPRDVYETWSVPSKAARSSIRA